MRGLTYADLIRKQIGVVRNNADFSLREEVGRFLGLPANASACNTLEWLGLFNELPMNRKLDTTFEVTSDLMIEKMALGKTERDMVVLQHTFMAGYSDGRKEVIRSRMLDFGVPEGDTSISRTVALPAAIAVDMILSGKITSIGVHIPVIPEIYNPVLDKLETLGIKMAEEYGLPLSENIQ